MMKSVTIITLLLVAVPSFAELNLALNRGTNATASMQHSLGLASYAVDGDYDTMWNAGRHGDPLNPDWLRVDLGDIYVVSEIVLWTDTYGESGDDMFIDYIIFISTDAILWTEIGNGRLIDTYDPSDHIQVNQSLQYIRFDVVGGTHHAHLNEIEVYEIPEPATLLLFGLGCFLVRRVKS